METDNAVTCLPAHNRLNEVPTKGETPPFVRSFVRGKGEREGEWEQREGERDIGSCYILCVSIFKHTWVDAIKDVFVVKFCRLCSVNSDTSKKLRNLLLNIPLHSRYKGLT